MKVFIFLLFLLLIPTVVAQIQISGLESATDDSINLIPDEVANPPGNLTFNETLANELYLKLDASNDPITGDLTIDAELNSNIAGVSGTWINFGALGGIIPVGQVTVISSQFVIQSLTNFPIFFANDDLTGLFGVFDNGMTVARSVTTFRAENATSASFEANGTSVSVYALNFFADIMGTFQHEITSLFIKNITTQDINVSGEWESGFTFEEHCSTKVGAAEVFLSCGSSAGRSNFALIMPQNGSIVSFSTSVRPTGGTDGFVSVGLEDQNAQMFINHTHNVLDANTAYIVQTTVARGTHKFQKGDTIACIKYSSFSIGGDVSCEVGFVLDSNIKAEAVTFNQSVTE